MAIQRVIIRGSGTNQQRLLERLCDLAATCTVRVQRVHDTPEATEVLCLGAKEDLSLVRTLALGRPVDGRALQGGPSLGQVPLALPSPEGRTLGPALVFTDSLEPLGWELSHLPDAPSRGKPPEGAAAAAGSAAAERPSEILVPQNEGRPSPGGPDDDDMSGPFLDDDPLTL